MKTIIASVLGVSLLAALPAWSAESESFYTPNRGGVLIVPNLRFDNKLYYVQLAQTGPDLTFRLLGPSVTDVTPQPGDNWATAEAIVGSWKIADEPTFMLTIDTNATFTLTTPADPSDNCPAGSESGPYSYHPLTGVWVPITTTDGNGICGFSHPTIGGEGPFRLKRNGADLELWVYDPTQGPTVPQITRFVPR